MDLIERQAAIYALCSECQGRCVPCNHYPCNEVKALKELPSAEPRCIATIQLSREQLDEAFEKVKADILSVKPKTGKWILHESPDIYHCSDCECPFCGWETVYDKNTELKWCACCGARLEV